MTFNQKNPTICFCHCVKLKEILEAIQNGADNLGAIQVETLASTGCGGCESEVLDILQTQLEELKKQQN